MLYPLSYGGGTGVNPSARPDHDGRGWPPRCGEQLAAGRSLSDVWELSICEPGCGPAAPPRAGRRSSSIDTPPSWWRSISCRNSTSSCGPVAARSAASSSVLAIPGMVATPTRRCACRRGRGRRRVGHPGHVPAARQRGRAPELQPALHAADLGGLGGLDVGGELPQHRVGGVVALPGRHLDGLLVVHGHVLREPDVDGVPARGRRSRAGQPEQQAGSRAEQQHAERRRRRPRPRPATSWDEAGPGAIAGRSSRSVVMAPMSSLPRQPKVTPVRVADQPPAPSRGALPSTAERGGAANGGGLSWREVARAQLLAARAGLGVLVLVQPQRADELVDARVVGVGQLELVAPGLQRDRLVQARVRATSPCTAGSRTLAFSTSSASPETWSGL